MGAVVDSVAERILPILTRYDVIRAGVFGSFAREEETDTSDLDLVVELPVGSSLLDLVGLEQDMSDELGIEVDVHTYRSLHPRLRGRILAEQVRIL